MSRGIDYSKWDHIDEEESSDDEQQKISLKAGAAANVSKVQQHAPSQPSEEPSLMLPQNAEVSKQTKEGSEKGRYRFEHGGRLIYEWEQNLDGQWLFFFSVVVMIFARCPFHNAHYNVPLMK